MVGKKAKAPPRVCRPWNLLETMGKPLGTNTFLHHHWESTFWGGLKSQPTTVIGKPENIIGKPIFPGGGLKKPKRILAYADHGIYRKLLENHWGTNTFMHHNWEPTFWGGQKKPTDYSYRETLENHWKTTVFVWWATNIKQRLACPNTGIQSWYALVGKKTK